MFANQVADVNCDDNDNNDGGSGGSGGNDKTERKSFDKLRNRK